MTYQLWLKIKTIDEIIGILKTADDSQSIYDNSLQTSSITPPTSKENIIEFESPSFKCLKELKEKISLKVDSFLDWILLKPDNRDK